MAKLTRFTFLDCHKDLHIEAGTLENLFCNHFWLGVLGGSISPCTPALLFFFDMFCNNPLFGQGLALTWLIQGKALVFYSGVHIVGHCIGTVPGMLQKDVAELNEMLGCAQDSWVHIGISSYDLNIKSLRLPA